MNPSPIPYEIRIGVTGHRVLENEGAVRDAVDRLLDHIGTTLLKEGAREEAAHAKRTWGERFDRVLLEVAGRIFPKLPITGREFPENRRTPLQWRVYSNLARGADQIVAEAVLSRNDSAITAVLPFPKDAYREKFTDDAARKGFDELYVRDAAPRVSRDDVPSSEEELRLAYLSAGREVVDSAEFLIAVWDGKGPRGTGGTGEVIEYATKQGRMVFWINALEPDAPVQLLGRTNHDQDAAKSDDMPEYNYGVLPTTPKELCLTYHELAAYNRDPAFDADECEVIHKRDKQYLLDDAEDAEMPPAIIKDIADVLMPHQARADQLAMRYQQLHIRSSVALFVLSSFAITVVVLQVMFLPNWTYLCFLEVAAMIGAVMVLRLTKRERWHVKWLHDRHFAERLRIQHFMACLGETQPAGVRAGLRPREALPFYGSQANWVDHAMERLTARVPTHTHSAEALTKVKRFLRIAWIQNQADWHKRNVEKKSRFPRTSHLVGLSFFSMTLVAAFLHALGVGHDSHHHGASWAALLISVSVLLPAWGAAIHAVDGLLEHGRIAERSRRMAEVLGQLAERLEYTSDPDEIRELAERARQVMASENHEWMVSLSFRGPKLPA